MKRLFLVGLLLLVTIGLVIPAALSDSAPTFTIQPVDSTTDRNGNLSLTFKGENYNPDKSSWHFVEPETGNEWTGPQLREEMKKRGVNGFTLTASDKKQVLFLQNVPEFMHGWEAYVVLVNNNGNAESNHFHIYWYGLDRGKTSAASEMGNRKVNVNGFSFEIPEYCASMEETGTVDQTIFACQDVDRFTMIQIVPIDISILKMSSDDYLDKNEAVLDQVLDTMAIKENNDNFTFDKYSAERTKINGMDCKVIRGVSGNLNWSEVNIYYDKKLVKVTYTTMTGNKKTTDAFEDFLKSIEYTGN